MKNKLSQSGYSLLELLIVILIIGILTVVALPYYQNAVQSARSTEAIMWWSRTHKMASGRNMTQARAERIENDVNENHKLTYFTLKIICHPKENDELCWEAQFHPKNPNQYVRYYLATQSNFAQLVCVPQNSAGNSFCQAQAAQDDGPDTEIDETPAYIIRY